MTIERDAAPSSGPAILSGVVNFDDAPLPGVTVTVRNEAGDVKLSSVTDIHGVFRIASLVDGLYEVNVALEGMRSATVRHLPLHTNEVTRLRVAMMWDESISVTVGALSVPSEGFSFGNGVSTTFSQDFVDKLPL